MAKQKNIQIYAQSVLNDKLELSYGVDYTSFDALKTCGLADNAHIQGEKNRRLSVHIVGTRRGLEIIA